MTNQKELSNQWMSMPDENVTEQAVKDMLASIKDDLWVAAASVDRVLDELPVQRQLIELGIERTTRAAERAMEAANADDSSSSENEGRHERLRAYFSESVTDARLCQIRSVLLTRLDRLRTYEEIMTRFPIKTNEGVEDEWEDDPWGNGGPEDGGQVGPLPAGDQPDLPPLSQFMCTEPFQIALLLASQMQFGPLHVLRDRHMSNIFPYRFEVLNQIPLFADSTLYRDLLPTVDVQSGMETLLEETLWRPQKDIVEDQDVQDVLRASEQILPPLEDEDSVLLGVEVYPSCLSADQILRWFQGRAEKIYSLTGMVDISLGLVQQGVSRGVLGLDAFGEDLTLLSRFVYDRPSKLPSEEDKPLSLSVWRSLEPTDLIKQYLAFSSTSSIVEDIRKLVMPYLFVLESKAERAGNPDPGLVHRLLYDYILGADLDLVATVFEASKPTMKKTQRIIIDDEDMARLALACLYGSGELDKWTTMSRIFECLPVWSSETEEGEEADTTVASLSSFLTPSTSRQTASPSDLLIFFRPLPAQSLSRALDVLDIHLESGEILARWGVAVPLRWLLQSTHDEVQQRAWAMRMARQADAPSGDLESEDIWLSLLEDMLKLARQDESSSYSAFGALSADEIRQIFFRGILSTGKFNIARNLILPRHGERLLDPEVVENICLECSREFYDNAESGNYNFGGMKLAYDCLSVCPTTPAIQREREFIEATSRISSFNVTLRRGVPLHPIEIRLTKDKLTLVAAVLSSNESAYKHVEVILELIRKLGFRDDVLAEVKTLAMISETALQAEDFPRAFEANERMVSAVLKMRATAPLGGGIDARVREAMEVCWVACYQLGRQAECDDVQRKLNLLGRSLEFCPPDRIADILPTWRKLDAENKRLRDEATSQLNGQKAMKPTNHLRGRSTLSSKLQDLHMPSPTLPSASSLASHTFNKVAASLPFSVHRQTTSGSRERTGSPDMQSQARHALQRGIGWLIGADEDEL